LAVQRAHVYGFNNAYILDAARRYPDRLTAMCMIDAQAPDAAQTVRELAKPGGAVAIRLTEPARGADPSWFASQAAHPVWRAAADLGIGMRLHFYAWNRDYCIPELLKLAAEYRSVPIVVDHLSSPDPAAGVDGIDALMARLAEMPNISILASTINFNRLRNAGQSTAAVVKGVVELFGSERVAWGSDIAQSSGRYDEMVGAAMTAVALLNEAERSNVLYATGQRLYGR
jgi:predicted TIM-barrel fold metal-dependent hydrolase